MSKKAKKKRNNPPTLSALDKLLYAAAIALSGIFLILLVLAAYRIMQAVAFGDDTVAAYTRRPGVLLALPFFVYLIISLLVAFSYALSYKKPIFGSKKIHYGQYPWPEGLYPLFDERRKNRYKKPSHVRFVRTMFRLWLIGFLLTLALTPFSIFGRNSLHHNGNISIRNAVNMVADEYAPEDYESLTLRIYYYHPRRSITGCWAYDMRIMAEDGTSFHFNVGDFTDTDTCLDIISKLKGMFPDTKCRIEGAENLDKLIDDLGSYTEKQKEAVREIFMS